MFVIDKIKKVQKMQAKPQINIIGLGNRALVYIDRVKKMNKDISNALGSEPLTGMRERLDRLRAENEALGINVAIIRQGGADADKAYESSLKRLSNIKDLYDSAQKKEVELNKKLFELRATIIQEVEQLKQVGIDLAATESQIIEYEHKIHAAVGSLARLLRREQRRVRREENEDSGFIKVLDNTIGLIDDISGSMRKMIVPNIEAGRILGMGWPPKTYLLLRAKIQGRDYNYVAEFFERYVQLANATCCLKIVENTIKNMENLQEAVLRNINGMDDKLEKFEAKHGENMNILKRVVTRMQNEGLLEKNLV